MNSCKKSDESIPRYVDNELTGSEAAELLVHVKGCAHCRVRLEEEEALSRLLREAFPLYASPAGLRRRVTALLQGPASHLTVTRFLEQARQAVRQFWLGASVWAPRWRVLAPTILTITICLFLAPHVTREVRAATYVDAAVSAHRSYLDGDFALGIYSDSPKTVTEWLTGKLPFAVHLPDSQTHLQNQAYRLTGAGLVRYRGCQAAMVTYNGDHNGKISLLVASGKYAVVAGGDEVNSAGLTFHYRSKAGFKVITWTDHGLSYALVSAVSASARDSCLICHQSMADRESFKSKP
jgi:anti-sigma factor RsiW